MITNYAIMAQNCTSTLFSTKHTLGKSSRGNVDCKTWVIFVFIDREFISKKGHEPE